MIQEKIYWEYLVLIKREAIHGLDEAEQKEFDQLYASVPAFRELADSLKERQAWHSHWKTLERVDVDKAWSNIAGATKSGVASRFRLISWLPYAAVLVICILLYVLSNGLFWEEGKEVEHTAITIPPGRDQALLVLGNGQEIDLSNESSTELIQSRSGIAIGNERVSYGQKGQGEEKSEINQLITPVGGRFQLELEDGTIVWLNSSSKISFPTHFIGKTREVHVWGEAYFDVAKDSQRPFIVSIHKEDAVIPESRVKVLGTEFNISAYKDQHQTVTTLIEGEVEVDSDDEKVVLSPGYQAISGAENASIEVVKANIPSVIGWKDKMFVFEDEPLEQIMNKIGRWYGVDIHYRSDVKQKKFSGQISQDREIKGVLDLLETTEEVRFILQSEDTIIVK
ncbi:DUF4974 domain-containing protein [Echinicola sediminis]